MSPLAPLAGGGGDGHVFRLRVFYEDTDAAGIVYYANYLKFAERARTELLRDFGVSQREMAAAGGPRFAVQRVEADFLTPARLDDELEVLTRVAAAGGARIEMHQDIRRGGDDLARLKVRIACVNARGRAVRLPAALAGQFASLVSAGAGAGAGAPGQG